MADERNTRLVKLYPRGQITIPAEFRQRLGIEENSILQMRLKDSSLDITPLRVADEDRLLREYDAGEIQAFLREDRIDRKTAAKVRKLLGG
jgi:AbrB family looped-hinge helix DNA binding protein